MPADDQIKFMKMWNIYQNHTPVQNILFILGIKHIQRHQMASRGSEVNTCKQMNSNTTVSVYWRPKKLSNISTYLNYYHYIQSEHMGGIICKWTKQNNLTEQLSKMVTCMIW